jgi:DNA-binding PadR family transcriptional regulator
MGIGRFTYPTACVLQALANGKVFGMDVIEHTGLPSGTVYPILRRFEREGLVESAWETPERAFGNRRPQRRNYRLTEQGLGALAEARRRYRQHLVVFGTGDLDAQPAG